MCPSSAYKTVVVVGMRHQSEPNRTRLSEPWRMDDVRLEDETGNEHDRDEIAIIVAVTPGCDKKEQCRGHELTSG